MADDCAQLMTVLGHDRFAVVGHDRGAYVAAPLAMDRPDRVSHLGVLDAIPIGEALARCDAGFAAAWWHWFFLGQTDKPAERVITADPLAWYRVSDEHMGAEAYADLAGALTDPATVQAMCEDYRAGLTVDRRHDDEDRAAGRTIGCPVLFGYAERDDLIDLYGDPAAIWRDWAAAVTVTSFDCGHHIAEERPDRLAEEVRRFVLGGRAEGLRRSPLGTGAV